MPAGIAFAITSAKLVVQHHHILELVPDRACFLVTLARDLRFPRKWNRDRCTIRAVWRMECSTATSLNRDLEHALQHASVMNLACFTASPPDGCLTLSGSITLLPDTAPRASYLSRPPIPWWLRHHRGRFLLAPATCFGEPDTWTEELLDVLQRPGLVTEPRRIQNLERCAIERKGGKTEDMQHETTS